MSALISLLLKTVFTETVIKKILALLGDYLVKSSKNTLDDKLWAQVKKKLF